MRYIIIKNGVVNGIADIPGNDMPSDTEDILYLEIPAEGSSIDDYFSYAYVNGTLHNVGLPPDRLIYDLDIPSLSWKLNLTKVRDQQWTLIKRDREATINAPLVTPYGTFDSDPKSRQNITDAILMLKSLEDLGSPTTIDFTLADDTARTLTTAEMVMVGLLLGQKIQAAHAQARALRGALDLATTKEEVEAITWQATT